MNRDSATTVVIVPGLRAHMPDMNFREWAAVVPLIVMMVWMGVYSQSFLPPVTKATARVLDQAQVNVPFRVALPPAPALPEVASAR